jgi:hypothetical protein
MGRLGMLRKMSSMGRLGSRHAKEDEQYGHWAGLAC